MKIYEGINQIIPDCKLPNNLIYRRLWKMMFFMTDTGIPAPNKYIQGQAPAPRKRG
jgi:hypothetical protein